MPAAKPSRAAIQRALEAVKQAGLTPAAITVAPDGTIRVETAPPERLDAAPESADILTPKKWATG